MSKSLSIDLGALQSAFNLRRTAHVVASAVRNNADAALVHAEEKLKKAESELETARTALVEGSRTVVK